MRSGLQKEIDEWLEVDSTTPELSNPSTQPPFFKMMDDLIAYHKKRRLDLAAHVVNSMSPVQYAMEFCTVRCDIGRRTGKTEYVKHRADEYSLVIVHREQCTKGYPDNVIVKNINELVGHNGVFFGKIKPRTIYIEEPQMVFRTIPQHELYYRLVDEHYDQTFVLLGA